MMENRFFSLAPRFSLTWERIFATYFRIEVGVVEINQSESRRAKFLFLLSNETGVERGEGRRARKAFVPNTILSRIDRW